MIGKKEISETLALSCIESYFLAWLNRNYDVTKLYSDSFISLRQAFDDFSRGATYQNYCFLPRIQDVAEEYGVVTHNYIKCNAKDAKKIIKEQSEKDLYLIRVNTSFFTDYKRASWREDHYVCVDKNLAWINQYPLSDGVFTEERFNEVYDGAVCIYKLRDLSIVPPDNITEQYTAQKFTEEELPGTLSALESAIGVLRVSRKRIAKYYSSKKTVKELLDKETACMDRMYFDIHLRKLKELKKEEIDLAEAYKEFYAGSKYIVETEKKIAEVLKNG